MRRIPRATFTVILTSSAACRELPDTGGPRACSVERDGPEESVDVLVIGSGPAGFAAAWEAREAGASVRVLERDALAGGAGRYSANMWAAGTPYQLTAGMADSPEIALRDWAGLTGGDASDPQIVAFVEQSADVIAWLVDTFDASVELLTGPPGQISTSRQHIVTLDAKGLGEWYGEWLGDLVRTGATAGPLVRSPECGVVGATILDDHGDPSTWIRAGAVVVATGGFARDVERMIADRPYLAESGFLFEAAPSSDAGGHALLETEGALDHNPGHYGVYLHATQDWRQGREGEALWSWSFRTGLAVDGAGRRMMDESDLMDFLVVENLRKADGHRIVSLWPSSIVSTAIFSVPGYNWTTPGVNEDFDAARAIEGGGLRMYDTVAEVAKGEGLDPAILQATFDRYETLVAQGKDADFDKPAPHLVPFGRDRIGVVDLWAGAAKAFTGIRTDLESRVLGADGLPIPGLWAAGEVAGMLGTEAVGYGFEGSMTACYHMGRVAGRSTAEAVLEAR